MGFAMKFNVGSATDIGRKRSQNQDSIASEPELGLFVVADGMGGHKGGETASSMVVEIVPNLVREALKDPNWDPRRVITDAITTASNAIYKRSSEDQRLRGMGTTTTAILFKGSRLVIGHVGDSRCYFLTSEGIWQATRDHSLVQEKLRAGLITREEVKTDSMKNVITRSVGFEPNIAVEIYEMEVREGDTFLLCSDGLSGQIDDPEIMGMVRKDLIEKKDVTAAVRDLIQLANEHGGDDNISTILVQVAGKS